jgi:hypothetical protein
LASWCPRTLPARHWSWSCTRRFARRHAWDRTWRRACRSACLSARRGATRLVIATPLRRRTSGLSWRTSGRARRGGCCKCHVWQGRQHKYCCPLRSFKTVHRVDSLSVTSHRKFRQKLIWRQVLWCCRVGHLSNRWGHPSDHWVVRKPQGLRRLPWIHWEGHPFGRWEGHHPSLSLGRPSRPLVPWEDHPCHPFVHWQDRPYHSQGHPCRPFVR